MREAVEEARAAVIEAIRESQEKAAEAQQEAAEERAAAADERASADEKVVRTVRRMRDRKLGDFLTDLAWLIIIASAILKVTYKRTIQAEVKAAVATETADSEQLKRQVVEARMAAMQAQVEPHFLFNTLASIDHLIETDPPRASTMQKNLIALLRASMPSMRESNPAQHNLGREMAVIRPYLEILKVRMEDRLQATINVPEGLLSAEFPPMMIQSLVENAIKHGLEPKAEGGTLTVSAEIVHGRLAVTVADTGLGFGRADTAGTGIGLANIRERLQAALRRQGVDGRRRQSAQRHGRHPHRALSGAAARRRPLVMKSWHRGVAMRCSSVLTVVVSVLMAMAWFSLPLDGITVTRRRQDLLARRPAARPARRRLLLRRRRGGRDRHRRGAVDGRRRHRLRRARPRLRPAHGVRLAGARRCRRSR